MIHCSDPALVQIHIPRTGGTSFARSLAALLPSAEVDELEGKHATARQLCSWEHWPHALRFALLRDPRELVASWYRHVQRWVLECDRHRGPQVWTDQWEAYARRVAGLSFEQFVRAELERQRLVRWPGFHATWCLGACGESLGVELFPFEQILDVWLLICRRLGLASPPPLQWVGWTVPDRVTRRRHTAYTRQAITELCAGDLEQRRQLQRLNLNAGS